MTFIKRHPLLIVFLLGLFLRISLIFLDYSFDVNNHISWAEDLWKFGFSGFFDKQSTEVYATLFPNYPPLSLFIFYLFYPLPKLIFSLIWWLNINIPLFPSNLVHLVDNKFFIAGMLKLPAIFVDLGLAYLFYIFAKKLIPQNKKLRLFIPSLILFNPAFFYNSAYWGQIDVIPIFLVLVSYYFLVFSERYILSGIFFTLALLVKPTAFVYLPIYIFFFIKKFGSFKFIKTLVISNILFIVSFMPFLERLDLLTPYSIYQTQILEAQSLPFVTNGAFSFWYLITQFRGIKDMTPFFFGITFRMWGFLVTGTFLALLMYSSKKIKNTSHALFFASFFAAFASFLFLTKMHERYLMLPLPFLLLIASRDQKYLKWFYLLSLISFINLYHNWPVPFNDFFVKVVRSPFTVESIVLILLFSFLFLFQDGENPMPFKAGDEAV